MSKFNFELLTTLAVNTKYVPYKDTTNQIDVDIFSSRATDINQFLSDVTTYDHYLQFTIFKDYGYSATDYTFTINGVPLSVPPIISANNEMIFTIMPNELNRLYNDVIISYQGTIIEDVVIVNNKIDCYLTYKAIDNINEYYLTENPNFVIRYNNLFNFGMQSL